MASHMPHEFSWPQALWGIAILYVKFGIIYVSYLFSKIFVAQNRKEKSPPFYKQIGGYCYCLVGVLIVAYLSAAIYEGDGEDSHIVAVHTRTGLIRFLVLALPALFGAREGFITNEKFPPGRSDSYEM
jgi:hypothetical protein